MRCCHLTQQQPQRRRLQSGFTLIELMIVVAIVAVLASIAYPAYTGSVIKSKRAEGRAALVDLMQQQERYMTQTGSYGFRVGGVAAPIAKGATDVPFKMFSGDVPSKAAYLLLAETCNDLTPVPALNECVRLVAEPTFVDAEVNKLRVMSTGLKDCTGSKSAICWK